MGLVAWLLALVGASASTPALASAAADEQKKRKASGPRSPIPTTQTRWYLKDVEIAEHAANLGDLSAAARLMRSARSDGTYAGVLSTRTDGLLQLPKRFTGDEEIIAELEVGHETARSVFDEIYPPSELGLLAKDGIELGVGVGEHVEVEGRDYPVFVRLDPEFLYFNHSENQWYYRSMTGTEPVIPGDGRWVLHAPGGRTSPWHHGTWRAIGKAFVRKEHAELHKDNYEQQLAHAARVAVSPQGASEKHKQSWFKRVMAWGKNTVFGVTPGYDVKLLESKGVGHESFDNTISRQERQLVLATAGQTVTTDGGAGFQNSNIHATIRADLIQATANALAYTLNTQGLPQYVARKHGLDAINRTPVVSWDTTPPADRTREGAAMLSVGDAIVKLTEALAPHGLAPDARAIAVKFGIPVKPATAAVVRSIRKPHQRKPDENPDHSAGRQAA